MTTPLPPARRRRFQFGLGTLLAAVLCVALAAAWYRGQATLVRQRHDLQQYIRDHGGSVYTSLDLADERPIGPLRRWLGDEPVARIYLPPPDFTVDDFARVKTAFREADVWPAEPVRVRGQ